MEPFSLSLPLCFPTENERNGLQYSWDWLLFTGLAHRHTRTHTRTQWKQIGWICSARRNVRRMCLCVLSLDDRAEGMKEGWRGRKKETEKRKKLKRGKKRKERDRKGVIEREKKRLISGMQSALGLVCQAWQQRFQTLFSLSLSVSLHQLPSSLSLSFIS